MGIERLAPVPYSRPGLSPERGINGSAGAPIPIDVFLARFPEFATESPDVIYFNLAQAARQTPPQVWGLQQFDASAFLAAHLLASRVHAVGSMIGAPIGQAAGMCLESTLYGQEYCRIRDTLPISGFTF